jgi:hypothetical protein
MTALGPVPEMPVTKAAIVAWSFRLIGFPSRVEAYGAAGFAMYNPFCHVIGVRSVSVMFLSSIDGYSREFETPLGNLLFLRHGKVFLPYL